MLGAVWHGHSPVAIRQCGRVAICLEVGRLPVLHATSAVGSTRKHWVLRSSVHGVEGLVWW